MPGLADRVDVHEALGRGRCDVGLPLFERQLGEPFQELTGARGQPRAFAPQPIGSGLFVEIQPFQKFATVKLGCLAEVAQGVRRG